MKNFKNNRGFVKIILLVVAALVLLKYVYKIDVIGLLTSGKPKELLDQFYSLGAKGWSKYYEVIAKVWNYAFEFGKNIFTKIK
jgi:hypothetical protein